MEDKKLELDNEDIITMIGEDGTEIDFVELADIVYNDAYYVVVSPLKALDGMTVKIDCDVIQADGGTRTASVTGGFVALYLALSKVMPTKKWEKLPITDFVAAVSCGIVDGIPVLDLDYAEDSTAGTDSNFVMNGHGGIIEIQGTAEHGAFSPEEYGELLSLAQKGIKELIQLQQKAIIEAQQNA